jgi:dolichyl-phosphate beta-glucosyltransferase
MRGFHMYVQLLVTRSVRDTQCGFKLFTRATAKLLFSHLHLFRWAFDTEIIYLAERLHIPLKEVPYDCVDAF